jgi:hypothetical protein
MSYTVEKIVNFGRSRAGLATVGYTLEGNPRTTFGVSEITVNLGGSFGVVNTGTYKANITFSDNFQGSLTWDTGQDPNGVSPNRFASITEEITLARLDLTQPIPDVKTVTLGGALAGAWATAFGKVTKNLMSNVLSIFGPGNGTTTPSATFQTDNINSPTYRNPI